MYLHNPIAHHRNHTYGFQVMVKNTPKNSLVSEIFQILFPCSEMPYHKPGRLLGGVPKISENPPVLLISLYHVTFSFNAYDFLSNATSQTPFSAHSS